MYPALQPDMSITTVCDAGYKYEAKFIAKQTQNIKCGLQVGFLWEMGIREYKSHVEKGLDFFTSVKLQLVISISHCPLPIYNYASVNIKVHMSPSEKLWSSIL